MDEKCTCSVNGYTVKDAEARQRLEAIEQILGIIPAEEKEVYQNE